jgi:glycosyltransferase involved in cell wall biosynthesis
MPERRYRILFVASHPVQYQAPLFRRMAKQSSFNLDVAYCTLRGAEAGHDPEFGASIQWDVPLLDGYSWTQVLNRSSSAESFFSLFNPGLWKLIRGGNYDAVVSYVGYVRASFWVALAAAKLSNTAFIFGTDAVSLAPRDGPAWKSEVKKVLWPKLFRLADQVIVPSASSLDLMCSLGIPQERVTLTPFVVDNDWWMEQSKLVDRAAVRTCWGATPDTLVILFSAKLQHWKRPLDLLRAFAKANLSNAILVFAGSGPLFPQLESEAASLGVASRVQILGFLNQTQLPAVYTAADLLVLPSEFEPFGLVVNEAMCCGCAVAASNRCGAARELVAPVDSRLVFPCGDIAALVKILRDAAADRQRLQSLGRVGLAHIQAWSPERNIAATTDAIRKAISRIGRAPMERPSDSVAPAGRQGIHQ